MKVKEESEKVGLKLNIQKTKIIPGVRRQGRRLRVSGCDSAGTAERSYPTSEVRRGGWEELYPPEARDGSREELPHARTILQYKIKIKQRTIKM